MTLLIILGGVMALAVAMGIGRFAFTPLMPLMIRDGTLDTTAGAEWAAANYVGYLAGALTVGLFSNDSRRGLGLSLLGIALTTLAGAVVGGGPTALAGALLRAAAGVFSAWALVCTSSWCLGELAHRQASHRGAWIYTGVGSGIALAGILTWLGGQQPASWLWLELGLTATLGAVLVQLSLRVSALPAVRAQAPAALRASPRTSPRQLSLVLCYGAFGFGYIVPATFLPAMAREQVPDPMVFGLTWPLFGVAAALSVAVVARWLSGWRRRRVWALAQGVMAVGTALPLFTQSLWALAASAVLVGGTFMVATMAGLQLARELAPANPTPLLASMTVAFAAGQIIGPLLVRALGSETWAGLDALALTSALATAVLLVTAAWLWRNPRSAALQPEPLQ
ncbi:YbfB/YjiJ family MFS transporter [Teichococcus vastitatis]|uniref:YbfB/YjiJ family MFS transporter n=1 Tax=Teichococcus vastitatis TaxID=2307076 RepID=A0ABS9W908_9PROT|nr:YbfB/YjiJ family MFS transporter [Pseudoroseomonas vastitatis]MCI0755789.1 YbfB/YjiJ family MFS transporter [Pseudoroseomonas vastitatis]